MLKFLLDEHLRGPLWLAIQRHNLLGGLTIDAVRVGDATDLPLASSDSSILFWAELQGRILVSEDKHTMPQHLHHHLKAGQSSPGVLMVRPRAGISDVVEHLELIAHAGEPAEFADAITFIP
jgi:hypothetical protein